MMWRSYSSNTANQKWNSDIHSIWYQPAQSSKSWEGISMGESINHFFMKMNIAEHFLKYLKIWKKQQKFTQNSIKKQEIQM